MKNLDWEDLRLFLHIAEAGGLTQAAKDLSMSPPTLGRRMLAFEQKTGQTFFTRKQTGYTLTPEGQDLLTRVQAMQSAALPVENYLAQTQEAPLMRISTGSATALFLADRISALSRPNDGFRLSFVSTETFLDIAHREVDFGIRNQPAETGNLASRKLGNVAFAPYRSWSVSQPEILKWIALEPSAASHPAARWVHDAGLPIGMMTHSIATLHQLVRAGAGIGIMTCMIGDADPSLARAGPIIEDLADTAYLVMHNDDRHSPNQRRVIDRLVKIYRDNRDLISGDRPLRS